MVLAAANLYDARVTTQLRGRERGDMCGYPDGAVVGGGGFETELTVLVESPGKDVTVRVDGKGVKVTSADGDDFTEVELVRSSRVESTTFDNLAAELT